MTSDDIERIVKEPERYGEAPVDISHWYGEEFTELMHWLYLPVHIPNVRTKTGSLTRTEHIILPRQLSAQGIDAVITDALDDYEEVDSDGWIDKFVYVTARRGFATPDNPLNRVGWHTDGFGTNDTNYIWCDRFPTRYLDVPEGIGDPGEDHLQSVRFFENAADRLSDAITNVNSYTINRLSPYVVHATPEIGFPGGMRSWVKVSISEHRYNLIGNSHNWELDYDWKMVDRSELRNDPAASQNDFKS